MKTQNRNPSEALGEVGPIEEGNSDVPNELPAVDRTNKKDAHVRTSSSQAGDLEQKRGKCLEEKKNRREQRAQKKVFGKWKVKPTTIMWGASKKMLIKRFAARNL